MKQMLFGVFGLLLVVFFQNCEPQQFQALSSGSDNKFIIDPPVYGVLGLYDYSGISFMKFRTVGGLMPSPFPELTIYPLDNGSIQVTVNMVRHDGAIECYESGGGLGEICEVSLAMSEQRVSQLKMALFSATLMTVHHNPYDPIMLDCGYQYLKFYLKNYTSHEYSFGGGQCSPDGALVIYTGDLQNIINEMAAEGQELLLPTESP